MKTDKIHFEISERKILLRILDAIFIIAILWILSNFLNFNYFSVNNQITIIVLIVYVNFFGTIFEMYHLPVASSYTKSLKSILLTTSSTVLFYLLTPVLTPILPSNRLQIILFYIGVFSGLLIWRNCYITFLSSHHFLKQALIIGKSKKIDLKIKELTQKNLHYRIKGMVLIDDKVKPKEEIASVNINEIKTFVEENNISEIIITENSKGKISVELYKVLLNLLNIGVTIRHYSDVYESHNYRLPIHLSNKELYNFFPLNRNNKNKLYLFFTRTFDILFSLIGLIVFSLFIPFILLFNLFWNKGPLFYKQIRVGKNGKPFKIIKLRTMVVNAEKDGAVFATKNDARITLFGKILRKSRLDEVPQFINVLQGRMSIIGPRPERPVFVDEITKNIPLYQTRHVVKPGLTGWAQVNYPYGQNLEDSLMKLKYDLYYIKHRSLPLDLNIFLKTVSTVLFFRGQ